MLLWERLIGVHFYCLPCTYRARAAEHQACKPQTGARRWERTSHRRAQGRGNGGGFLLKKSISRNRVQQHAVRTFDSRRGAKEANVSAEIQLKGPLLSTAYLTNRKQLWLGTLSLKNCSSQNSARRIRPYNQPDTKIQRCNYYPLKPNE